MTEKNKIQKGLSVDGRKAYDKAKRENNAYIVIGNSIYLVKADGSREKIEALPNQTRVKVTERKFTL